jgi:hypothetical protein
MKKIKLPSDTLTFFIKVCLKNDIKENTIDYFNLLFCHYFKIGVYHNYHNCHYNNNGISEINEKTQKIIENYIF